MSSLILCLCPQLIRLLFLCVLRHFRVILHAKFPWHLREEAMLPQRLREQGGTISPLTDFVSKDEHRASLNGAHQHVPGDKTSRAGGGQLIRPPRPAPIWGYQQVCRYVHWPFTLSIRKVVVTLKKKGGEGVEKWKTKSLKAQSRIAALVGVCKQRIGWI